MKESTQQAICCLTYFVTFVVCPAIAGYCLTTLYFIVKDFPNAVAQTREKGQANE